MLYYYNKQKLASFMSKIENLIILDYFIQKTNEFNQLTIRNNQVAGDQHIKNTKNMRFQLQSYLTVKKIKLNKATQIGQKPSAAKKYDDTPELDELKADLSSDSLSRDQKYIQKYMNKNVEKYG